MTILHLSIKLMIFFFLVIPSPPRQDEANELSGPPRHLRHSLTNQPKHLEGQAKYVSFDQSFA